MIAQGREGGTVDGDEVVFGSDAFEEVDQRLCGQHPQLARVI